MSGGVMSNVALDAALDELGMLSSSANSRLVRQRQRQLRSSDTGESNSGMRSRASSMSTLVDRLPGVLFHKAFLRNSPYRIPPRKSRQMARCGLSDLSRSRTRSENESDVTDEISLCSSGQLSTNSSLSSVPCISLPIDICCSNLFKSRSMESIKASASEESIKLQSENDISEEVVNAHVVDSVSSDLHRLNVNE